MGTLHDKKKGLQKNLADFAQELEAKFPDAVLTSGYRPGAKTTQGKASRHSHGEAVDFRINPKLASYLESPEGVSLLYKYKLGFLDESKAENKKWGNALHIGQDSALWKKTQEKYNKLFPKQEEVTDSINFFDYKPQNTNFVQPLETEEEEITEEKINPKVKEIEDITNFLNDYQNEQTPVAEVQGLKEKIDLSKTPETDFLEEYNNISNFLSPPTAQQGKNVEYINEQEKWLNDWVKNRKINNISLDIKSRVPISETLNYSDLNPDKTQTGKTFGQYDPYDDVITYDTSFEKGLAIPAHENTHRLQNYLLGEDKKKYLDYIHNPVVRLKKGSNSPYLDDPQEIHSRIMSLRKNRGFKPDQVIKEEDLEGADLRQYDLDRYDREDLINTLNSTVGNYKPSSNNYAQQGGKYTEKEQKDQEWLKNWYQNRKIPNKDIQSLYLEDKPYYEERLANIPITTNVNLIDKDPKKTGQYQGKTGKLLITPRAQPSVYSHEVNHYLNAFPSHMRTVHENIVEQNMYKKDDPRLGGNNKYYDYFRNPDEIHSRIQVLRKDAGFKPDEEVTHEKLIKYLENYKGDDENILQIINLTDDRGLLEMLNYMADNSKVNKNNYAQQGEIEEPIFYDIKDQRKIRATTNKPINPNKDLVTGKYDKKRIDSVIQAAIRYNQNPYTMVALGLAESGYKEDNVGQILGGATYGDEAGDLVRHYVEKAKGLNEIDGLTRYNGTGKVGGGTDGERGSQNKQMYGVPIPKGGLDMGKTKLYSKNVLDLRDNVISKNKEINNAIERYKKDWNPFENEFNSKIYKQTTAEKLMDIGKGLPVNFQQGGNNYTESEQAFLAEINGNNVVKDNNGYWDPNNWGKTVEISGPSITMKGVNQPLYGYSPETGEKKIMIPGKDYYFKGAKRVIESPAFSQQGITKWKEDIEEISESQMSPANPFTIHDKKHNSSQVEKSLIDLNKVKDVKALQQFLVDKGYNLDPNRKLKSKGVDGKVGKYTLKAVNDYNAFIKSNLPVETSEYSAQGDVVNAYNPIELKTVNILPESKKVKAQLDLIKKNNYEDKGKPFAIVNKKANIIHYYDQNHDLISSESIITGADDKDKDYSISMRDWIEQNPGKTHDDYFDYLKKNKVRVTPSGHFTIASSKTGVNKNQKNLTGRALDYIKDVLSGDSLGTRSKDIEDSRTKDYGRQGKLFTLKSDEGTYSSKAIHGTDNTVRKEAFNSGDPSRRNLSNGCINVNGETKCFDILKRDSSIYILPENGEDLVSVGKKSISNGNTIQKSKSRVYNTLVDLGITPDKEAVDFISAVHGKESSFGTDKKIPVQDLLPIFDSDGEFQINPETFKKYLPKDYSNTFEKQVQAVYNFYKKNKDTPEKLYNLYNAGSKKKVSPFLEKFSKVYGHVANNY
jgi:hypothetical protein